MSSGKVDMVKFVLQRGANVNTRDRSERSPAKIAVSRGNLVMVKLLCDAGANLANDDAPDSLGDTLVRVLRDGQYASHIVLTPALRHVRQPQAAHRNWWLSWLHAASA